jgi:hypothetical protein
VSRRPPSELTIGPAAGSALRLLPTGDGFVATAALRTALDGLVWAPIQLAARVGARPISPRLPHALVLSLALHAREDGAPVRPDIIRLAAQVEATPSVVEDALRALVRDGVLVAAGDGREPHDPSAALPPMRVAPHLLGPAPRAAGLDWRWLANATAGAPSAWVAAHALAEWLDTSDDWVSIPRNLLQPLLGSGLAGVRNALSALVAAAVLERREVAGRASHYRFGARARGLSPTPSSAPSSALSSALSSDAPAAPALVPPAESRVGAASGPVEVTIGGATFEVGPGARIALNAPGMVVSFDVGPDGRTRVVVVPPADGPAR